MKKEVVTSERISGKTSEKNNTEKSRNVSGKRTESHHRAGNNMAVRVPVYITGLFIMTLGIGISVKSDLGVSPVSSIPYTMTCVWGIEMGKATILFHAALVAIQIILLRRRFRLRNLLRVQVGIMFGYFTTFSNYLMSFLPDPHNIAIQLGMLLISTLLVAVGLFFYVPADIHTAGRRGSHACRSRCDEKAVFHDKAAVRYKHGGDITDNVPHTAAFAWQRRHRDSHSGCAGRRGTEAHNTPARRSQRPPSAFRRDCIRIRPWETVAFLQI